jgi:hypothetical protein
MAKLEQKNRFSDVALGVLKIRGLASGVGSATEKAAALSGGTVTPRKNEKFSSYLVPNPCF